MTNVRMRFEKPIVYLSALQQVHDLGGAAAGGVPVFVLRGIAGGTLRAPLFDETRWNYLAFNRCPVFT